MGTIRLLGPGRYRFFNGPHYVIGSMGADTVYVDAGNDTLLGNDGKDALYGGADNDRIEGGTGDDELYGGSGNDRLFGGAGHDTLDGGAGIDVLTGGSGGDTYIVEAGDRVVEEAGGGMDTVELWSVDATRSYTLAAHVENLEVFVKGPVTLNANNSNEFININSPSAATVFGKGGNDTILGGEGSDTIYGGDGDDIISGDEAGNILSGGSGRDTFVWDHGNDTISDFDINNDLLTFESPSDVQFLGLTSDYLSSHLKETRNGLTLSFDYRDSSYEIHFQGINNKAALLKRMQWEKSTDFSESRDLIQAALAGGGVNVTLSANGDLLDDGSGNDTIFGGAGDDRIELRSGGYDKVYGGAGDDAIILGSVPLSRGHGGTVAGGEGQDAYLYVSGNYTIDDFDAKNDQFTFHDGLGLFGPKDVSWRSVGGGVELTLPKASGGGKIFFKNATQTVVEKAIKWNIPTSGDDNLTLLASGKLAAGDGNDFLSGSSGNDMVLGQDGDDQLFSTAGKDSLYGGNGSDVFCHEGPSAECSMYGGNGHDEFLITAIKADRLTLFGGSGADKFDLKLVDWSDWSKDIGSVAIGDFQTDVEGEKIILTLSDDRLPSRFTASDLDDILTFGKPSDTSKYYLQYDRTDGKLWYNPDGAAKGGLTLIAEFLTKPALSLAHFDIA